MFRFFRRHGKGTAVSCRLCRRETEPAQRDVLLRRRRDRAETGAERETLMKWNAPYAAMDRAVQLLIEYADAKGIEETVYSISPVLPHDGRVHWNLLLFHFLWDVFSQMFCGNTLRFDSAYQRFGALPCSRCQTASGRQYFTAVCILYILYLCLCCMIKGRKTA